MCRWWMASVPQNGPRWNTLTLICIPLPYLLIYLFIPPFTLECSLSVRRLASTVDLSSLRPPPTNTHRLQWDKEHPIMHQWELWAFESAFARLALLVCLPPHTFRSGVKASEKVETGCLLSCISTCGAAESIISRREASSRLSESWQGLVFFFLFPFAMGGCTRRGGGRGSSEKLFSSLLYVAGAADGARQHNSSDSRTKTSSVRVRAWVHSRRGAEVC